MEQGVIYILTNPSFPDYVKIGYADDVERRLSELNRSECVPYAFRLYAYYRVPKRLTDMKLHQMIDKLNPSLRSIEEFDGKTRKREFYNMSPADAYYILETIAQINVLEENLVLVEPSESQLKDEEKAELNRELAHNRHHFKDVEFSCSLTGHRYKTATNEKGTLSLIDLTIGEEVPNNSKPSKKEIAKVALFDLNNNTEDGTLYQLIHKIEKVVLKHNK